MTKFQVAKLRSLLTGLLSMKPIEQIINDIQNKIKINDSEQRKKEIWREIVKPHVESKKYKFSDIEYYLKYYVPKSLDEDARKSILSNPNNFLDPLVDELCKVAEKADKY